MIKKIKGRKLRIVRTKRNIGLEPRQAGARMIIGYDPEIHDDDSVEFTYRLPLGAIKRLIQSYYEDIETYEAEWVYYAQSSSSGIRVVPYCYRMLDDIRKQLDKHELNGEIIVDEVFELGFKAKSEEMKRFKINHGSDALQESFKKCEDPLCCK